MRVPGPLANTLTAAFCALSFSPALAEGPYVELRGGMGSTQPDTASPVTEKTGNAKSKRLAKKDREKIRKENKKEKLPRQMKGTGVPVAAFDFGKSWSGAVEVGYQTDFNLRLGFELVYSNLPYTSTSAGQKTGGNAKALTGFLNVYYDIPTHTRLTPYVGAGIGYTGVSFSPLRLRAGSPSSGHDRSRAMAYQLIAGASYKLSPSWALTLDYRHMRTDDLEMADAANVYGKVKLTSNNVFAGVRYSF